MAPLTIALPTYHSPTYQVLGTPSEEDLASIANAQAVQFLRTLPIKPKRCVCAYVERDLPQGYGYAYHGHAYYGHAYHGHAYYGHAYNGYAYYGYACYGRPWSEIFPSASEQCLDLLARMLVFNPAKRCSMQESYLPTPIPTPRVPFIALAIFTVLTTLAY